MTQVPSATRELTVGQPAARGGVTVPAGRRPRGTGPVCPRPGCRDLDDRISQLMDLRDRLTGCIGCGCLSLTDCQLANPDDLLGASGAGPVRLSGQPGHGQGRGQQDDAP
jgi:hypothetical protein